MTKLLKILLYIFAFLFFLNLLSFFVYNFSDIVRGINSKISNNDQDLLFTRDFMYKPYIGYNPPQFKSETINIGEDYLRKSYNNKSKNIAYIFGGSSVWGAGVKDENTISSELNKLQVFYQFKNYGQMGYTLRQNYNQIFNEIILDQNYFKNSLMIFIFGFNDIYYKCLNANIHADNMEKRINTELSGLNKENRSFKSPRNITSTIFPLMYLKESLKNKIKINKNLGKSNKCKFDEDLLLLTMNNELNYIENLLIEKNVDIKFILQPINYDNIGPIMKEISNFIDIYENLRTLKNDNFIDMSDIIDNSLFLDEIHLNSNGNKKLSGIINSKIL